MAHEPKMKKGVLSQSFRKYVAIGLMAITGATAGLAPTEAHAGSDTLKSLGNVILDNIGGQVQNGINNKVNKTSCQAKGGIWEHKESASTGYGTNGKSYKGGAAGKASGKCHTGTAAKRYVQKAMKHQYDALSESTKMQADANKQLCLSYTDMFDRKEAKSARSSCNSLRKQGSSFAKTAKNALWNPTQANEAFGAASRNLEACYDTVSTPLDITKCNIKFTKQISFN